MLLSLYGLPAAEASRDLHRSLPRRHRRRSTLASVESTMPIPAILLAGCQGRSKTDPRRAGEIGPPFLKGHRPEAGGRRGRESLSEACGQGRERR
jgi:hypothetical protein